MAASSPASPSPGPTLGPAPTSEQADVVRAYLLRTRAIFGSTRDVQERLELWGLATRDGDDEKLRLRADLQASLDASLASIEAGRAAGLEPVAIAARLAEAARGTIDRDDDTFVLYVVLHNDALIGAACPATLALYVGETAGSLAQRWKLHPNGCPKLSNAMAAHGGKGAWRCEPVMCLPADARHKELLLYIEGALQRALQTVGTPHGLNCHYANGKWGGQLDDERWTRQFLRCIEHAVSHGYWPRQNIPDERELGRWITRTVHEYKRGVLAAHRAHALELVPGLDARAKPSRMTTDEKIAYLLASDECRKSGGWTFPPENKKGPACRLRQALRGQGDCSVTAEQRALIESRLPGLVCDSADARFFSAARTYAEKYRDPVTGEVGRAPYSDRALSRWAYNLRCGTISLTDRRLAWLRELGLESLVADDAMKSAEERAAIKERMARVTAEYHAREKETRDAARDAKRRRVRDLLAAEAV